MKSFYYLKYFYFIARNWNIRLAAFTVYHEIRGEKKYQLDTIKVDNLQHQKIESENLKHASIYQGTNYYLIEKAFEFLRIENANYSIVDLGCGKGRVLIVAAYYGFKKITGVDFLPSLCNEAKINLQKIKPLFLSADFEIICVDAANYPIKYDDTVFFFFNPFDEVVMLQVVKNILTSIKKNSRKIYIVYVNPVHKEIFLSAGFEEEYYFKKMSYLEFVILSKDQQAECAEQKAISE
ncbi:MAG: class I SAM-dependent methyltransferase [Ginsengibacter sp.]